MKIDKNINVQSILHALLIILITANVLMLIFYNTTTYRIYFHSDAAAMNLMADEVYRTGDFFPKEWNYPNGDLWALYGHLFIIPLLPFFENSFALHSVSGVVTSGLVIVSAWLFMQVLELSLTTRLIFTALITTGISPFFSEQIFGQLTYGTVLYLNLFYLYFFLCHVKNIESGSSAKLSGNLFAGLVFLLFLSQPARALATYAIPLIIGVFVVFFNCVVNQKYSTSAVLTGIKSATSLLFIAAIAGSLVYWLLLTRTNYQLGAANAHFLQYENISHNISGTLRGWLNVTGGLPSEGVSVLSAIGINKAYRLLAALALLVSPFFLAIKLHSNTPIHLSLISIFSIASVSITVFFQIFTTVPDMSTSGASLQSARYMLVGIVLLVVALFAKLDEWIKFDNFRSICAVVIFSPILLSGYSNLVDPAFDRRSAEKKLSLQVSPYERAITLLKKEGLDYGFSSFWNANVITVLSGGLVKIRAIHPIAVPIPAPHLSSNDWYRSNTHIGPTFLMLSSSEYASIDWSVLNAYLGKPMREIHEGSWTIVVYSFNIASRLLGWDDQISMPLKLVLTPNAMHQIGSLVYTGNEAWLEAAASETGYLSYGPYIKLARGRYEAVFELMTDIGEGALVDVDVAVNGGVVIAKSKVKNMKGWQNIILPFEANEERSIYEFRVFSHGHSVVKSKAIIIRRQE